MARICIYGAGAIGGLLAAALAEAGAEVCLIARGRHLDAIRDKGLRVQWRGTEKAYRLPASDNPAEFGVQRHVVLAMKAHAMGAVVDAMQPLLGADTSVVPAINGLPWWYFHKARSGTAMDDQPLDAVDPGGRIWRGIGPGRVIGCVVYPACEIVEPGLVRHVEGDRFTLGEPDGSDSARMEELAGLLIAGGLRAPRKSRAIREEIWVKLLGNCAFNPVAALTGATLDRLAGDGRTRALIAAIMAEARAVGERLGIRFPVSDAQRIAGAGAIVGHKPSMLQDFEHGRFPEIGALVDGIREVAARLGMATPMLDAISALVTAKARAAGLASP